MTTAARTLSISPDFSLCKEEEMSALSELQEDYERMAFTAFQLKEQNGKLRNAAKAVVTAYRAQYGQMVLDGRIDALNRLILEAVSEKQRHEARPRSAAAGAPTFREEQT